MVTGVTETRSTRPTSSFTNFRRYQEYDTYKEGESTPRRNEERLLNAIETIPQRIKSSTTNTKLLQTHVPNFRGQKDKIVEFEHLLLNHLSPLANKITEENKLHFFSKPFEGRSYRVLAIDPDNATDNAERCARPVQRRIREGGS